MSISGKVDPVVRRITAADIVESLVAGVRDFQALPLYGLTFGAIVLSLMVGTGVLMATLAFSFQRYFEYQVEEGRRISE